MPSGLFDVEIAGAGACLPDQIATNEDLIAQFPDFPMTAERIYRLLGARERRIAPPNLSCADLMARAGQQALDRAGIAPGEVDLIIACPNPPDALTPPSSAVVQHLIGGAPECTAFDLNMACTSSIAAMEIGCRFLETGHYRTVLITAGAIMSRLQAGWTNPMHRFIFGDGAGAVVLRRATRGQQLALKTQVAAEGGNPDAIFHPLPHSLKPPGVPEDWTGFFMQERDYFFDKMMTVGRRFVEGFWTDSGWRPEQFTHAVIHQPSRDLFLKSVEVVGIPLDRVYQNFTTIGNIIAAELFVALHDLGPHLQAGDRLFSWLYGAGFTLGALAYEMPAAPALP